MAVQQVASSDKVLCRILVKGRHGRYNQRHGRYTVYFMNGVCKEGSKCKFSHNLNDKPSMVCKFYLQGSCSYGSQCRYDHAKPLALKSRSSIPKPVVLPSQHEDGNHMSDKFVVLRKSKKADDKTSSLCPKPEEWVQAPVFVPGKPYKGGDAILAQAYNQPQDLASSGPASSYSDMLRSGVFCGVVDEVDDKEAAMLLCPFAAKGVCPAGESCCYLHGMVCDICDKECLHPYDMDQRQKHKDECIAELEKDMEHAFAVQRSEGVTCGVCMDVVTSKVVPSERRFGILSDCNHAFCLSCIRTWRTSAHVENKIVRACPICRVPSGFVTPSEVWIEDPVEKERLIEGYKTALSLKPCKHFDEGRGTCPFGNSCFYKHAYPDGSPADEQLRHYNTAEGDVKVLKTCRLWDYFETRQEGDLT